MAPIEKSQWRDVSLNRTKNDTAALFKVTPVLTLSFQSTLYSIERIEGLCGWLC